MEAAVGAARVTKAKYLKQNLKPNSPPLLKHLLRAKIWQVRLDDS